MVNNMTSENLNPQQLLNFIENSTNLTVRQEEKLREIANEMQKNQLLIA